MKKRLANFLRSIANKIYKESRNSFNPIIIPTEKKIVKITGQQNYIPEIYKYGKLTKDIEEHLKERIVKSIFEEIIKNNIIDFKIYEDDCVIEGYLYVAKN